jgi:hypothetical protein
VDYSAAGKRIVAGGAFMKCCHHWIIETPDNSGRITVDGVCKKCGKVKRFYTVLDIERDFTRHTGKAVRAI